MSTHTMPGQTDRDPDADNRLAKALNAALAANSNAEGMLDARDVIFACMVVMQAYIQGTPVEIRPKLLQEALKLFKRINDRVLEEAS